MSTAYEMRYRAQQVAKNADQAESDAIRRTSTVIDAGIRDDTISGALDDIAVSTGGDDGPGSEEWADTDLRMDGEVGGIREELERRQDLLGGAYPFRLQGERLLYTPGSSGLYEFCLAICLAQSITKKPYVVLPRGFERISAKLIEFYMGVDSESLHLGWPRDNGMGRKFKSAMKNLERLPYEWVWSPEDGKPEDPSTTYAKDEGIDFVVMKRLLDGRAGRLYVLGQCACGDDWDTKWSELSVDRLRKWFRTVTLVPFVRAFVTPYFLADEMLREASGQAGLVFDRARLTMIAETYLNEQQVADVAANVKPMSELVLAA